MLARGEQGQGLEQGQEQEQDDFSLMFHRVDYLLATPKLAGFQN